MMRDRERDGRGGKSQGRFVFALLVLLALSGPVAAREKVRVTDAQGGCFYGADASYSLKQKGSGYGRGKNALSAEDVDRLREVLLRAEDGREDLMQSLGITRGAIDAHRESIVNAALQDDSVTPRLLPKEIEHLLEFDSVRAVVFEELNAGTSDSVVISTSWCHFSVELPGEPVVRASSRSCRPWMLQWTIRAGDREWRSWSTAVPEAMRQLVAKKSPNASLLDGERCA